MPAVSPQDFEAIKQISALGLNAKIYTFARAMNADIDKRSNAERMAIIEVPIGYPKLKYQFKWTWEDVLKKRGRDQLCQRQRSTRSILSLRHYEGPGR